MVEPWVFLSISAALIWASTNVIDKILLSKFSVKPVVPMIISGIVAGVIGGVILIFHGFGNLSFLQLFLALVAGIVYILNLLLYFKAIKIGDISSLVPLYYLVPLFIAVFAWILLGERLSIFNYFGTILLMIGALLISWDNKSALRFNRPFWIMIAATLLLAINQVITKYLFGFSDFWTIFAWVGVGCFLPVVGLFIKNHSHIRDLVRKNKNALGLILTSEILYRIATGLITLAVALGPVTLVNALSSVQPFFVLLFVVLFSLFMPSILKEDIAKSKILLKIVAIMCIFAGGLLIN